MSDVNHVFAKHSCTPDLKVSPANVLMLVLLSVRAPFAISCVRQDNLAKNIYYQQSNYWPS